MKTTITIHRITPTFVRPNKSLFGVKGGDRSVPFRGTKLYH